MSKKDTVSTNEIICPGCKEKLSAGTKKCKWCGTFITSATVAAEEPKKKSWFKK